MKGGHAAVRAVSRPITRERSDHPYASGLGGRGATFLINSILVEQIHCDKYIVWSCHAEHGMETKILEEADETKEDIDP